MSALLVLTNLPDRDSATAMATALVERGLAACVNSLGACRSTYRWDGRIESAEEFPLLIKTTTERYPALEAAVSELHPYDVPELVAVEITTGLPAYLGWLAECCKPASDQETT
ncbi:MAG TPA: divalent-cation tolerance protein CutA [Rhodocyclaceae bacterium]